MAERPANSQQRQTFVEALMAKYKHPKDLELDPDIFLPRQAPAKADSSGNIEINTEVLALNGCGIDSAGDIQQIQDCLKSLREVDLTSNNLSDWAEVYKMIRCMPVLEFLNLTDNLLTGPVPSDLCSLSFPSVCQLVLNGTGAMWASVRQLAHCFPNVEELHLSLNGYTYVELDGCVWPSVTALYFNGNGLSEWDQVAKLGVACPELRTLVMGESFYLTSFGESTQCLQSFPNLSSLTVSDIAVQDWEHIDTLTHFPALTQLKVQRIPLMETYGEEEGRQLLVARLPNITKLNGSPVTPAEREDAERAFIRYYMDRNQEDRPTRYAELEAKYGRLDPLVKLDLKPKETAHVKMTYGDKVQVTDVNLRQTVKQFKKACEDFVGLPMAKFRIYHHENQLNLGASVLRASDRMMFSINVRDGDEFEFVLS